MSEEKFQSVSISIGSNMYGRFEDLPNTVPHVFGEFIDNALQSFKDNESQLKAIEPDYELKVTIDIDWDETTSRATKIAITDNAAGINEKNYKSAFMPAKTPENNQGLNEFGMGLKTAACWLGETWTVITKALGEDVERILTFDLNDVIAEELEELPITLKSKPANEHYTIVTISDSTKNVPTFKSLPKIKTDIASIYRKSLRVDEMQIFICGGKLNFIEYNILTAPFERTPNEPAIYWKKDIDFKFGKYSAKGFIGILRDIDKDKNGFVLLRRGRVIIGAESDGRYFPKSLSGSLGTFRYKRTFGELELEGFEVAFNKNDIQDKENLEALMEALRDEIHTKDFDLYAQAEEYRLDDTKKKVNRIIRKHNNSSKTTRQPINIDTTQPKLTQPVFASNSQTQTQTQTQTITITPPVIGEYKDTYNIDGEIYTLNVQFVSFGSDLFWVDISKKSENIIICQINTGHIFFNHFGPPSDVNIAILKTMAIAKFTAKENGDNSATDMFNYFNEFIKKTRV